MSKFVQNGQCGYVLQPQCFLDPNYHPFQKHTLSDVDPLTITLTVRTSPPRSRYVTITLTGVDPFTLPLTVRRHYVRDSSLTSGESRSWYITTMLVVHHRHAQVHSTSPPC